MKKSLNKKSFKECAIEVVRGIKKGTVLSYKEVAKRAGNANAARAVGTLMRKNKDNTVPCHRVICSCGKVGAYNGLLSGNQYTKSKRELLESEGITFVRDLVLQSSMLYKKTSDTTCRSLS